MEDIITTNIIGVIYGSQIAATSMLKQKHGVIYSMEGLGSNNMIQKKTILYGTTKHALTYFITKSPDSDIAAIQIDQNFKNIFNILADKPEIIAAYLEPRILKNKKNNTQIVWLSNIKATGRFLKSPFVKRELI